MDKAAIIEMLRADMRGEHQAIIQYLNHAYSLEEAGVAPDIEAIAREEMRHLDWLADAITGLGGDPDMGRDEPDMLAAPAQEQMLKDVDLEQQAIDQYRRHIEAIDAPEIRRLLARIVHDEEVHQSEFRDMASKLVDHEVESGEGAGERLAAVLNRGIQHEYTVVLQYLYHSFVSNDCEEQEELQNAAINEMQHMGWLAEGLQEEGTQPAYRHDELFLSRDPVANLEADLAIEEEVTRMYSTQIPELPMQELKTLLSRVRDHEIYHADVFRDLLQDARERMASAADVAAPEMDVPSEPEPPAPAGPPPVPPIGSLIH
ncbi:MAG: ferritin-like domain-containing protein [Chloroflexi bacterium]|nr:ferritin-like domain-containing protein [Chloroflexota bacterium]